MLKLNSINYPDMEKAPTCPSCGSISAIRKGIRKNKLQAIQKYKCKSCRRVFTQKGLKHKNYPAKIILNAISNYNLGNNLEASAKLINSRFKTNITSKNVQLWVKEFASQLPFSKLRKEAINLHNPKNIIHKQTLNHLQPYTFKYHKAKLYLIFHSRPYNNEFHNIAHFCETLKNYLEKISTKEFPHHIFTYNKNNIVSATAIAKNNDGLVSMKNNYLSISVRGNVSETDVAKNNNQRASQIKFNHLEIKKLQKNNFACKMAELALNLAISNKERHNAIRDFFLINDSTTIAAEVPVYLTNWDVNYYKNQKGFTLNLSSYTTPITGHIDILQIRNGLLHILDYKPEADKQNPIEQLTIYALSLSRKLKLPLYYFKCAWFDEDNYYEFFPLHAVYEKK